MHVTQVLPVGQKMCNFAPKPAAMQFTFSIDVDDWLEFQKYFLANSRVFKRSRLVLTWLLPLVLAGLLLKDTDFSNLGAGNIWPLAMFGLLAIAWIVFFPNFYFNRVLSQARKMVERDDNGQLLGERTLKVDANKGLVQHYTNETFEVDWDAVVRIETHNNYWYLFNTEMSAIIVPILKVKSNPAFSELQQLLTKRQQALTENQA